MCLWRGEAGRCWAGGDRGTFERGVTKGTDRGRTVTRGLRAAVTPHGHAVAAAARKRGKGGGVTSGRGRTAARPPGLQGALFPSASRRRNAARRRMLSRLQELRKEEETLLRVKAALHDQLTRLKVEGIRAATGREGGSERGASSGRRGLLARPREGGPERPGVGSRPSGRAYPAFLFLILC